jgi:NADH-ubiquinone oxidoreductase chain 6
MLYIFKEIVFNGYKDIFLDFLYVAAIICGILVIITKNPIVSVLFLIGLFLSISCYLIMLGLNFIGLSYLLVYIGAVSILFLFILMLINIRISELLIDTSNSIPLAIILGISFNYSVNNILPYILANNNYYISNIIKVFTLSNDVELYHVTSKL